MRKRISFGAWCGAPLEWLVLDEDEGSLTLWCKNIVGKMPFSDTYSPFYAECTLRSFLAGEFYEKAFSPEEQECILPTELDCTEQQTYCGAVGAGAPIFRREPLSDCVFLLSIREMMKTYALTPEEIYRDGCAFLWSRSPFMQQTVSLVASSKEILSGKSPYLGISESYDRMSDTVKTSEIPYSSYPTSSHGVTPAIRIRK